MMNKVASYWMILIALCCFAGLRYGYGIMRFDNTLSDYDTAQLTRGIDSAADSGSVIDAPIPYDHGYAYQALAVFLMSMTGLSVSDIQLFALPLMEVVVVFLIFSLYSKLLNNRLLGLFATFLLYLQPDFMWVIWRGSHERIDWPLISSMIFLLASSYQHYRSPVRMLSYVLLFYLCAFAQSSSNTFYASSFMAALLLSYVTGYAFVWILKRRNIAQSKDLQRIFQRLIYVVGAFFVIEYLVLIYIYPQAQASLFAMKNVIDQFALLLLNFENVTNPYSYVNLSWLSAPLYIAIYFYTWLILIAGFISWLMNCIQLLRKSELSENDIQAVFLLATYCGFVMQLVFAVMIDLAGAYAANLQLRVFTGVILVSVPFAAKGIWRSLESLFIRLSRLRLALAFSAAFIFLLINITSLFKASNEPFLNNRWLFSTSQEAKAVEWLVAHAENPVLWIGLDERILSYTRTIHPEWSQADILFQTSNRDRFERDIGYFLVSDIERFRWYRAGLEFPSVGGLQIVYQNANTTIYYRRALTPYQR
jgi:hypothetical protein